MGGKASAKTGAFQPENLHNSCLPMMRNTHSGSLKGREKRLGERSDIPTFIRQGLEEKIRGRTNLQQRKSTFSERRGLTLVDQGDRR